MNSLLNEEIVTEELDFLERMAIVIKDIRRRGEDNNAHILIDLLRSSGHNMCRLAKLLES